MVFQESKGPGATEDLQELLFLGLKAKGAHQGIQASQDSQVDLVTLV